VCGARIAVKEQQIHKCPKFYVLDENVINASLAKGNITFKSGESKAAQCKVKYHRLRLRTLTGFFA